MDIITFLWNKLINSIYLLSLTTKNKYPVSNSKQMLRCPNCNYLLVLLERRRKYKCAKCSGLFPQKEIEDKNFVQFNKKRRKEFAKEVDEDILQKKLEEKKSKKRELTPEEIEQRKIHNKEVAKRWREKNRDKILAKRKEFYRRNKERLLNEDKDYRRRKKAIQNVKALRNKQKALALETVDS